MSLKDLPTTIAWAYIDMSLAILSCIVMFALLITDLIMIYCEYYAQTNVAKLAASQCVQRAKSDSGLSGASNSEPPESNQVTTDIDTTVTTTTSSDSGFKQKPGNIVWGFMILRIFMYICYICNVITAILFKLGIGSFSDCSPCGVQGMFYVFGKTVVYLLFIYRLFAIYSQSVFQYNTRILTTLAVICVFFPNILIIINLFAVTSISIVIHDQVFCGCTSPTVLAGLMLLFDFTISVLCCYLFVRPIIALNKLERDNDPVLYATLIKYTALTFVAVISTFVTLVLIILFKLNGLVTPDAAVNCFCIFLFHRRYDAVFNVVCCGPRKCGEKAADSCCAKK